MFEWPVLQCCPSELTVTCTFPLSVYSTLQVLRFQVSVVWIWLLWLQLACPVIPVSPTEWSWTCIFHWFCINMIAINLTHNLDVLIFLSQYDTKSPSLVSVHHLTWWIHFDAHILVLHSSGRTAGFNISYTVSSSSFSSVPFLVDLTPWHCIFICPLQVSSDLPQSLATKLNFHFESLPNIWQMADNLVKNESIVLSSQLMAIYMHCSLTDMLEKCVHCYMNNQLLIWNKPPPLGNDLPCEFDFHVAQFVYSDAVIMGMNSGCLALISKLTNT